MLSAFAQHGIAPRTRTDPYPDLGLQAVRQHLGVVIYARGAFPHHLDRSAFIPLQPPLGLVFHIATRQGVTSAPVRSVLAIADALNLETAA